ncbi:hypothetical protein HNY73_022634 [Argiope bruennichi]|uniref:Uncharacterized protein n=1 Tax=Argiope bruennichi TaxID=94029 RepID=A0A8T0E3V6_ARGBR|nr:hypothetical protein HNY73_022634 [Argiope bruennichi]
MAPALSTTSGKRSLHGTEIDVEVLAPYAVPCAGRSAASEPTAITPSDNATCRFPHFSNADIHLHRQHLQCDTPITSY